jgi:hypothetical protein
VHNGFAGTMPLLSLEPSKSAKGHCFHYDIFDPDVIKKCTVTLLTFCKFWFWNHADLHFNEYEVPLEVEE